MDRLKLMVVGLVALLAAPLVSVAQSECVARQFVELQAPMEYQRDWGIYPHATLFINVADVTGIAFVEANADSGQVAGWLIHTRIPADVQVDQIPGTEHVSYFVGHPLRLGPVCRHGPPPAPPAAPEEAATAEGRDRAEARRFELLRALDELHRDDRL